MTAEVLRYATVTADGHGADPAGVVLDAQLLTDAQMLAVAEAIGYPGTAFVLPDGAVRFFSPVAEVAFCGPATVAAAVALAERAGPGRLRLTTRAGPVTADTRLVDGVLATRVHLDAGAATVRLTGHATRLPMSPYDELEQS